MTSQDKSVQKEEETFKRQLDRAADTTRELENQKPNPIVEKITEYVPAAAKILPARQSLPKEENHPPGPPQRPHHDDKIEDFVRDQHRSQGVDGILGASPNDK
ncbi:Ff.00g058390.m01.CDS01 [Fusarium sp. VM40]|nr:Ff.00g058390.m01.CDS01 [Fusarium sp. VM40]